MTPVHFVFVRAMNTGGRRLTNEQQLDPFRAAGYDDVEAYQAAGNIVIRSDRRVESAELEPLLASGYGFEAPTFVRTAVQLHAVVDGQPFTDEQIAATGGKVQVAFLARVPSAIDVADVMALVPDDDQVVIGNTEWYWLPVDGISGSSLPATAIERILGPMTIRTLGTVERMLEKYAD